MTTKWTEINLDDYKNLQDDDIEIEFTDEDDDKSKNKSKAKADDDDEDFDDLDQDDNTDQDWNEDDQDEESEEEPDNDDDEESDEEEERTVNKKKGSRSNERIRTLNAQKKAAEARAAELEEEREAERAELAKMKKELLATKKAKAETLKNTVESQKVIHKNNLESLRAQLKKAHEEQNSDDIVRLSEELGQTNLAIKALESFKPEEFPDDDTDDSEEDEKPKAKAKAPKLEDAPKATQRWVKANSWFTDPESRSDVERIEEARIYSDSLIRKGYDPKTKEFYDMIDKRLRKLGLAKVNDDDLESEAEMTDDASRKDVKTKKKISQTVQSSSRTSPRKNSPNKITLTAEQKNMADQLGVDYVTYAKELKKLEAAEKSGSKYVNITN
jgi:hypothetical protein